MGRMIGQWEEEIDPSSGRPYYVNVKTNETTWELPSGADAINDFSANSEPAGESEGIVDPDMDIHNWQMEVSEEGEVYYFNSESGEVSWDPPAGWSDHQAAGGAWDGFDPQTNPANWVECPTEDGSEGVYYFNTVTQESTWDMPECLQHAQGDEGGVSVVVDEGGTDAGTGIAGSEQQSQVEDGRRSTGGPSAHGSGPGGGGKSDSGAFDANGRFDEELSDGERTGDHYEFDADLEATTFQKVTVPAITLL